MRFGRGRGEGQQGGRQSHGDPTGASQARGRQLVRKEGEQAMGKEQPVNGQRCQDSGGGEAGEGQRATSKTPQLRQNGGELGEAGTSSSPTIPRLVGLLPETKLMEEHTESGAHLGL